MKQNGHIPVEMEIDDSLDVSDEKRVRTSFSTLTLRKKGKLISSWHINDPFAFQILAICKLNCDSTRSVEVSVFIKLIKF